MRSFQATAVIFVIGVLASKVITGCIDSPLYNRFYGEVVNGYDWKAPKTGVQMEFELYRQYHGGTEKRFIQFKFTGKPEVMAAIGVPNDKVTCSVIDAGTPSRKFLPGLNLIYRLSGEDRFCSALQIGASQGWDFITVVFDGKHKMLSSEVRRNNSRGIIVGMMQNFKYSNWTVRGGV